jgi:hypothetical protein
MSPRREAFGLLHCSMLEKGAQFFMACCPSEVDGSGICGGGLPWRQYSGLPSEEWWMITAVIIADAVVDVASPTSSHVAVVAAPKLLLELHT